MYKNSKYLKPYIYSFFVPALLFLLACVFLSITPFGDQSLIISDMNNQYIDYLSYLETVFTGENNLFYTFSKTIGGDMIGFSAYYLLSPVNILLLLFSQESMPVAITFLVACKLGLCGLTANIFLSSLYEDNRGSLLFSTAYALCAYNIAFCFNTMWTDSVAILPIIALGINRLVDMKKPLTYIISLAAALIVNYYIGYMLCIFSVLYYFYKLIVSWQPYFWENVKTTVRFGVSSLLAGGLSAFSLIPVFLSLDGTKAGIDFSSLDFAIKYYSEDFFAKLFTASVSDRQLVSGMPNIFCGLLVTVLVILYFFNKNFSLKEKFAVLAVSFVLFYSSYYSIFDTMWHGFAEPTWFPFRYSFVFSFFMVLIAFHSYKKLDFGIRAFWFCIPALCFLSYVPVFTGNSSHLEFLTLEGIVADCAVVIILTVLLLLLCRKAMKNRKILFAAIAVIHLASLTANIYLSLDTISLGRSNASSFSAYVDKTADAVNWVKEHDDSFYRMEKTFERSLNDAMQFSYNGLTHFSSTEKTATKEFAEDLGLRCDDTWVRYNRGTTLAAESLLGLKYVVSNAPLLKDCSLIHSYDDFMIYQNDYALPMVFVSNSSDIPSSDSYSNTFEWQNDIFSSISSISDKIYIPATVYDIETQNLETSVQDGYIQYDRIDTEAPGYLTYHIKAENSDTLYLYIDSVDTQTSNLYVNDVPFGKYFNSSQWEALAVGSFEPGETVSVKIETEKPNLIVTGAYFFHEDTDCLKAHAAASASGAENAVTEKISSSHIRWSGMTDSAKTLVLSAPADKGWRVYIDGKETDIHTVAGLLIAADVPEGNHTVDFRYHPPGLKLGCMLSAVCATACASWFVLSKRNK